MPTFTFNTIFIFDVITLFSKKNIVMKCIDYLITQFGPDKDISHSLNWHITVSSETDANIWKCANKVIIIQNAYWNENVFAVNFSPINYLASERTKKKNNFWIVCCVCMCVCFWCTEQMIINKWMGCIYINEK